MKIQLCYHRNKLHIGGGGYIYIYIYKYTLGMYISITEADAIRISMLSQGYDTLKIHMKQLAIRFNPITITFRFCLPNMSGLFQLV